MKFVIVTIASGLLMLAGCTTKPTELSSGGGSAGNMKPAMFNKRTVKSTLPAGVGAEKTIQELYTTDRCGAISRGGFTWSTNPVVFDDMLQSFDLQTRKSLISRVDFTSKGVLMVDFGEVPTRQHSIKLFDDRLVRDADKAIVQVDLVKANTVGKKVIQVVSHPCTMFVVPRVGYNTLEIQSSLGDVFTSFKN